MISNDTPLISVVIPYYNRHNTLTRALDSVRKQSYGHLEIIAVDDGSSDGSFELVEKYRYDYPDLKVTNIRQANAGPSAARNAGVRAAQGKYIAFLDSDDSWLPEKLEFQMERMKEEPDLILVGTNYMVLLENGEQRIAFPGQTQFIRGSYKRMLFKVFVCIPSVIVDREVFTKYGIWFREGKNHAEDSLFFLQVARNFEIGRLHEPLTCIHKQMYGEDGLTADMKGMLYNDIDNCLILAREPDWKGKRLNPIIAHLLIGWMYLKHLKRLLVVKRQEMTAKD